MTERLPDLSLTGKARRSYSLWSRTTRLLAVFITFSFTLFQPALPIAFGSETAPAAEYASARTVKGWLEQGRTVAFLDVRTPEEYAAAHLPNAINIYYSEVTAATSQLPAGDQTIVIYCTHSTYRAPAAAKILREVGVGSVVVLEGGIVAWRAGGLMILAENLAEQPRILQPPDCTCAGVKKT